MAVNKVMICGVNTAKLPLLSDEEKDALFERIYKWKFKTGVKRYSKVWCKQCRMCR